MNPLCLSALPTRMLRAVAVAAVMFSLGEAMAAPPAQTAPPAASEIQKRLAGAGDILKIGSEDIDLAALRNFYQARSWRPAWNDTADKLIAVLAAADQEGLTESGLHLVKHEGNAVARAQLTKSLEKARRRWRAAIALHVWFAECCS